MADFGFGPITVDPPVGPTFAVAPPMAPSVLVLPVAGARGSPGAPGGSGLTLDDNNDGTFTLVDPITP